MDMVGSTLTLQSSAEDSNYNYCACKSTRNTISALSLQKYQNTVKRRYGQTGEMNFLTELLLLLTKQEIDFAVYEIIMSYLLLLMVCGKHIYGVLHQNSVTV